MHKYFSYPALAIATLLLAACGGIDKYNPFSESKPVPAYKPENATEYQCANNKRFYVRKQDKSDAIWLIYPNREVNLDKVAGGSGTRYSNGIAILDINGTDATLNDGPTVAYTDCKAETVKK
jgi:membrane-bound inhibitor of C-type lysozyme